MTESAATEPLEILRERLARSPVPLSGKDLMKGLKKPGGQTADAFARSSDAALAAAIASGRAFRYPSGSKGADRYWHRDEKEVLREVVLAGAAEPAKLPALKKLAKEATKADRAFADAVVDELVAAGQLHPHPGPGAPHGRERPVSRNDREKVGTALLAAAAAPAKLTELIARSQAATGAEKSFVAAVATALIEGGRLHPHGTAKTAPYGRDRPRLPHPLEVGSGKAAFAKLVAATRKMLDSTPAVTADELLGRLRGALAENPLAPATAHPAEKVPAPSLLPVPEPRPAAAVSPEEIGVGLKSAYDELCLDPEFEDKVVEIRRLYHEAARSLPGLTVELFHRELEHLQSRRAVELHPLNEVQRAKEPALAIRRGDRLLYFVRWR